MGIEDGGFVGVGEEGDFVGVGGCYVDDEVWVVEFECVDEVVVFGGCDGEIVVVGVFEVVDGVEFLVGRGDFVDFVLGGVCEVVYCVFGEVVGDGEDLFEFEVGGFGKWGEVGVELVFGDG